jgi:hypothetical protein
MRYSCARSVAALRSYNIDAYSSAGGGWKGEMLNQEHTPAKGDHPVFGAAEVGIGFSGTCTRDSRELEGIALAGKRRLRLAASLKLMRRRRHGSSLRCD